MQSPAPTGLLSPGGRPRRSGAAAVAVAKDPHAWEEAKENYKPLPGGRTAAALKERPAPLGLDCGLDAEARATRE